MSNKPTLALIAALAVFTPAFTVVADDGHKHSHEHAQGKDHDHAGDGNHAPKHGGQIVEDDSHHSVEMVTKDNSIIFHLSEHHEPLDLTGTTFKAVIQADDGTKMLPLKSEGSTLTGTLDAPLKKGAKVVLTGKDGHGDAIQARFVKD